MTPKLVFFYSDSEVYASDEPVFYPDAEQYPAIRYVMDHYETIRGEVQDYLDGKVEIPYVHPSPPQMNAPRVWRNVYFKNYSLNYGQGRTYFPRTFRLFADRPEFTLAGITTLAPGGRLLPHCGETNAVIRCHVGLKVPGTLPQLGLRVNGEPRGWQEGKVVAFNDAYQHEIWNDTDQPRHVLAFDIIRPEFSRYRLAICAYCLGIQLSRFLLEKLGLFDATPVWLRSLLAKPLAAGLWCYLGLASLPARLRRSAPLA